MGLDVTGIDASEEIYVAFLEGEARAYRKDCVTIPSGGANGIALVGRYSSGKARRIKKSNGVSDWLRPKTYRILSQNSIVSWRRYTSCIIEDILRWPSKLSSGRGEVLLLI